MFLPHFIFYQDQKYIKKHIEGKLSPSNLSDGIISCVIKIKKGLQLVADNVFNNTSNTTASHGNLLRE